MEPLLLGLGGLAASGLAGALSAASTPKIDAQKAARGAFSNQFGEIGDVAARRAQSAFDNLGNTAGARLAANNLNSLGAAALGGVQSTSDAAAQTALMNYGNTRRNAFDMAKLSGGSPAAIAGIASKLGEANTQTTSALAGQGSDAVNRAIGVAGNNYSQAQNVLQNDLGQQLSIAHEQLADFNPAMMQAALAQQQQPTALQGLGQGLATGLGSIGSRSIGGSMSGMFNDMAMKDTQMGVFSPKALEKWILEQVMGSSGSTGTSSTGATPYPFKPGPSPWEAGIYSTPYPSGIGPTLPL